jgi:glycosyltransferase involved in cell wall biosynthesis
MINNIALRQKMNKVDFAKLPIRSNENLGFQRLKQNTQQLPEILFVTSYPPRECGLATYSQDLINAITNKFESTFHCSICALETQEEKYVYVQKPKFVLYTDCKNSYSKTAFAINKNTNISIIVIQHEFGFFAKNENDFTLFYESIIKPIVFVFHTVLPNPNKDLKQKVQKMAASAAAIVVMTNNAASILMRDYDICEAKITIIHHGTHLVAPLDKVILKKKFDFENRIILSTFGLLSSSKGIETTLDALPAIIKIHPTVLFLILGKTHPNVVKNDGEVYRQMLQEKVNTLQLNNHVQFVNEYLHLDKLLAYLQLTDIYLFTSKDPNQAVSGTFSYALSAGCPIVSTPIPHAIEMLNNNCGIIIDFENVKQLSTSVINLLHNDNLRNNIALNGLHKMAPTAWENAAIAHVKLFQRYLQTPIKLVYKLPKINLNHIKKMTTDLGIIQFSKIANPDIHSGFTLDDNARALVAICMMYETKESLVELHLIETYLRFIKYCLQPNGTFLNYVNEQKQFTKQNNNENLDDSNGRAIWALGYVISLQGVLPNSVIEEATFILEKALPNLTSIQSTRAMAFMIKGLHYQNNKNNLPIITLFADRLVQMYRHEKTDNWHWFENYLTYGNSILPEALLCAYSCTQNTTYKNIAKESFDFLLSKIFVYDTINVISNKGWMIKDEMAKIQIGGEQPIDVSYTIMALVKFYKEFKLPSYKEKITIAFNWFLGENHLHQIIYNPCTGGCYDGLEEESVNLNQGAESTISYAMAMLTIRKMNALQLNTKPMKFYSISTPLAYSNLKS